MTRHLTSAALLAACCVYYVQQVAGHEKSTVSVDLYYESLCPDSIYFITKELGPIYDHLKSVLKVKLYPFGKSTWVGDVKKGTVEFACHHGSKECEGNIAQACAFDEIKKSLAPELQQDKQVRVAYCVMNNRGFAENVPVASFDTFFLSCFNDDAYLIGKVTDKRIQTICATWIFLRNNN